MNRPTAKSFRKSAHAFTARSGNLRLHATRNGRRDRLNDIRLGAGQILDVGAIDRIRGPRSARSRNRPLIGILRNRLRLRRTGLPVKGGADLSPNVISVGHEDHPSNDSWQTNVIDGRAFQLCESHARGRS